MGGGRLCVVEAQEGEAWGRGVYVCCRSTGRGGDMCAVCCGSTETGGNMCAVVAQERKR